MCIVYPSKTPQHYRNSKQRLGKVKSPTQDNTAPPGLHLYPNSSTNQSPHIVPGFMEVPTYKDLDSDP